MIKLLDCTLRDGGYINDWKFGKKKISGICRCLIEARIDIVEVGFLTDLNHTSDHSLYSSTNEIDAICPQKGKSMLAAMIALGEKEMDPSSLPDSSDCNLDIVRITFHRTDEEISRAVSYAKCLMAKGYKVCMQPVGTTSYTDKQLLELIEQMNTLKPYAFYLVDTLGILCEEELLRLIYLIDYNLADGILFGFHSHNNLQMSFADAQVIIDYHSKRDFIVDCSIYGMGRGAGNLCTELITEHINKLGQTRYNMIPILEAMDNYIYPIYLTSKWGYSAHYYIAATHKCHPNYAAFLMNKQTLTMNQVNYLLKNIPQENKYIFNKNIINDLYYSFQSNSEKTCGEEGIKTLSDLLDGKNILVLAPGNSVYGNRNIIDNYITENNPIIISINACIADYHSDFVFFSNQKRLYEYDSDNTVKMILTSNLSGVASDAIYVNYSQICGRNCDEADNSGMMILRLLNEVGIKSATLAGYDGFGGEVMYSYNTNILQDSSQRNQAIALQLKEIMKNMDIRFLTPSKYLEIIGNSIGETDEDEKV